MNTQATITKQHEYIVANFKFNNQKVFIKPEDLKNFPSFNLQKIEEAYEKCEEPFIYAITGIDIIETDPAYPDAPTHQIFVANGYEINSEILISDDIDYDDDCFIIKSISIDTCQLKNLPFIRI